MDWKASTQRERREMVERYGKEGRRCIEMVPWRGNSNGVVKIERGRGIKRKMREREESEVLQGIRDQT